MVQVAHAVQKHHGVFLIFPKPGQHLRVKAKALSSLYCHPLSFCTRPAYWPAVCVCWPAGLPCVWRSSACSHRSPSVVQPFHGVWLLFRPLYFAHGFKLCISPRSSLLCYHFKPLTIVGSMCGALCQVYHRSILSVLNTLPVQGYQVFVVFFPLAALCGVMRLKKETQSGLVSAVIVLGW